MATMKSLMKNVKNKSESQTVAWEANTQNSTETTNTNYTNINTNSNTIPSSTLSTPAPINDNINDPANNNNHNNTAGNNNSLPLVSAVPLPRCRFSRNVSREVLIHNLPSLRDSAPTNRKQLLFKKIKICSVWFRFDDKTVDSQLEQKEKELKRTTLLELVNFLTVFKPSFTEDELSEIFEMIQNNLFRPLPPNTTELTGIFNPEEDEPASELSWPHLQVVYEFLLRLATATDTDSKLLDKFFNRKFVLQLLELFDSEDPRERDYLKTILHRIYGNFMSLRPFIRRSINNVFYRFIYETDRHNGIAELLEILGSIINGFALPLKEQHKQFLQRVLLPLHKVSHVSVFHPQLSYCVTQFLEKDATLAPVIVNSILKFWPATSSKKELMFLNELEEILDRIQSHHLKESAVPLFKQLAKAINSPHFQVSERAIYVLNNDVILRFITANRTSLLPILARALLQNTFHRPDIAMPYSQNTNTSNDSETHDDVNSNSNVLISPYGRSSYGDWKKPSENPCLLDEEGRKWFQRGNWNPTIVDLTSDILKLFAEMDAPLFASCTQQFANLSVSNSTYADQARKVTATKMFQWEEIIQKAKKSQFANLFPALLNNSTYYDPHSSSHNTNDTPYTLEPEPMSPSTIIVNAHSLHNINHSPSNFIKNNESR